MTDQTAQKFQARQVTRPRDQVEQQIREAILDGQFAQGEKLPPETALAQQFGVSRPTIREALGALVSAGLIRKIPGVAGGSFVNTVTPHSLSQMLSESMDTILRLGALDVAELTSVADVLEVPAAEWAAKNRSQGGPDTMHAIVAEAARHDDRRPRHPVLRPRLPHDDRARFRQSALGGVHRAQSTTRPTRRSTFRSPTKVGRHTVKQHMEILAAIENGNGEAARDAMDSHLEYVLQYSSGQVHSG